MSINLTDIVVPQKGLIKIGLYALAGVAVLGLLWFVIDRVVYKPARDDQKIAQLKVDVKGGEVTAQNAKDASETGDRVKIVHDRIERITRENTIQIMAAPSANQAYAADVDRVWITGICVREGARGQRACDALSGAAAGVGDGADAVGGYPPGPY